MRRVIPLAALLVCAGIAVAVAAPGLDANQAVIMKYVDIWNKGDMALADEVLTASVARLGPDVQFSPSGIANVKAYIAEARETYPDLKVTINKLESEADRVIMSWTFRGTYAGTEFPEAAGARVRTSGTSVYRLAGGKIAEERISWDVLGVYHQLGVDPPEDQARGNIALLRRFIHELYDRGNLDAAYEIVAEDHVFHVPAGSAYRQGRDAVQKRAAMFRAAFPDLRFVLGETFASGDMVATHWTFSGTHRGGFLGVEPTGKRVTLEGLSMARVKDGQVAETWGYWDTGEFLSQVGAK
jgi:steroid delta-isomerase-like uncharacterized protein